ncbi:hypothetical protein BC830DRAFT_1118066, partial [Chytriomyces sp. MP71]
MNDDTIEPLVAAVADGFLLARILNTAVPGALDETKLHSNPRHLLQRAENIGLVLQAAREAGVILISTAPVDILDARNNPTPLLGLLWQLVKMCQATHNPDLQTRLKDALAAIQERDATIAHNVTRIHQLESDADAARAREVRLEERVAQLEEKALVREDEKGEDWVGRVARLERELAECRARNAELEARNAELEVRTAELEAHNAEADSMTEEPNVPNAQLEARNGELERELHVLKTQLEQAIEREREAKMHLSLLEASHCVHLAEKDDKAPSFDLDSRSGSLALLAAPVDEDVIDFSARNAKLVEKNAVLIKKLLALQAAMAGQVRREEDAGRRVELLREALLALQAKLDAVQREKRPDEFDGAAEAAALLEPSRETGRSLQGSVDFEGDVFFNL